MINQTKWATFILTNCFLSKCSMNDWRRQTAGTLASNAWNWINKSYTIFKNDSSILLRRICRCKLRFKVVVEKIVNSVNLHNKWVVNFITQNLSVETTLQCRRRKIRQIGQFTQNMVRQFSYVDFVVIRFNVVVEKIRQFGQFTQKNDSSIFLRKICRWR